jgi:heme-degrading monooxygenase HmoA
VVNLSQQRKTVFCPALAGLQCAGNSTGEKIMILEVAVLDVRPGLEVDFEAAFREAQQIISSMPGYLTHQLQRCMENPGRYLLLVNWAKLEDHTVGFRQSDEYQEWRRLLHHFYNPFPSVEHYKEVILTSPEGDCKTGASR